MSKTPAKPKKAAKPKPKANPAPETEPHPEVAEGEVERLHYALHIISGLNDPTEMRRVANVAMAGEKHGHEIS